MTSIESGDSFWVDLASCRWALVESIGAAACGSPSGTPGAMPHHTERANCSAGHKADAQRASSPRVAPATRPSLLATAAVRSKAEAAPGRDECTTQDNVPAGSGAALGVKRSRETSTTEPTEPAIAKPASAVRGEPAQARTNADAANTPAHQRAPNATQPEPPSPSAPPQPTAYISAAAAGVSSVDAATAAAAHGAAPARAPKQYEVAICPVCGKGPQRLTDHHIGRRCHRNCRHPYEQIQAMLRGPGKMGSKAGTLWHKYGGGGGRSYGQQVNKAIKIKLAKQDDFFETLEWKDSRRSWLARLESLLDEPIEAFLDKCPRRGHNRALKPAPDAPAKSAAGGQKQSAAAREERIDASAAAAQGAFTRTLCCAMARMHPTGRVS